MHSFLYGLLMHHCTRLAGGREIRKIKASRAQTAQLGGLVGSAARVSKAMVLSIKPAAPAGYYFQRNGMEAIPSFADGIWFGLAQRLGVGRSRVVKANELERLLRREAAAGDTAIFNRNGKSSGCDFVFSAPKSVSIAWALGGEALRYEIETAQMAAVRSAVELFFARACCERRGKGGRSLARARGVVAAFNHVASRTALHGPRLGWTDERLTFPDPNLHTHVVIPDLVVSRVTGALKIAYTGLYPHWGMALGAWYHASLAYQLRKIGFGLKPSGQNGLFQLADPGDGPSRWVDWIVAFSARTRGARMVAHTLAAGTTPPEATMKAFRDTRSNFKPIDAEDLERRWLDFSRAVEFDKAVLARGAMNKADDEVDAVFPDLIEKTMEDLTAGEAVFQEQDFYRVIASHLVAMGVQARPTHRLVRRWIDSHGLLQELTPTATHHLRQWTSAANLEDERQLQTWATELARERSFPEPMRSSSVEAALRSLTDDQRYVASNLLSAERLQIVTGAPGTGKSHLLEPVIRAFEEKNGQGSVIAAAEAWRPALALKDRYGIEAYSLARLFHDHAMRTAVFKANTVLIVDEAGLLPTKRMRALLEYACTRGMKLILVGDEGQLNPIGAGSGMRLLREALSFDPRMALSHIIRTTDVTQRQIVEGLVRLRELSGDIDRPKGIVSKEIDQVSKEVARNWVASRRWSSVANADIAADRIVDALISKATATEPARLNAGVIALARSNREVHHVSRRLRDQMKANRLLSGPDLKVIGVSPMGVTVRFHVAVGDRIRFLVRSKDLGVYNGTCARIAVIEGPETAPQLTVEIEDGQQARTAKFSLSDFHDEKKRARIAPAYVATIYGVQGITEQRILVLKGKRLSFREFYVAATRAATSCDVVEVNPKRAFLERLPQATEYRVQEIGDELSVALRRDKPKAVATGHDRRTNAPIETEWPFAAMLKDLEGRSAA